MNYPDAPRAPSSPDARAKARALLGAAQRTQDMFAHALHQQRPHSADGLAVPPHDPGGGVPGMIANACDQDLLQVQTHIAAARQYAQGAAATDAELQRLHAAAYGHAPQHSVQAHHASPPPDTQATSADVIDVQARDIPPAPGPTA